MNIFNTIFASNNFISNDTIADVDIRIFFVGYSISFLLSFPTNFYVIWLIGKGTGNGLAAEFFILNLSICEVILCVEKNYFYLSDCEINIVVFAIIDGLSVIGHQLFESLICVERYLAVVHPVTFLKFKPIRYRLMCSAIAWIISFILGAFNILFLKLVLEVYFIILITPFLVFLFVKLYCCLAVLRVLKQSGPGERGREREEENHMKKRAFYLIVISTVCMFLMHSPCIFLFAFMTHENKPLFTFVAQFCFSLTGLVQPVLFFYREGKLNFMKCQ